MTTEMKNCALVVGAGPAGLMAAEMLARAGKAVVVADAKPSVGRKFLMAGKSGLNLTKDEEFSTFLTRYGESAPNLAPILKDFGPEAVKAWANGLKQEIFTGSSGRVFPRAMKASPLLRAWLAALSALGVSFRLNWRLSGWENDIFTFQTPDGQVDVAPKATVLALGGASWPRLGSDGAWVNILAKHDIPITPLAPANAGLSVDWSAHMAPHFGAPVKAVALMVDGQSSRGEFVIARNGLEGSGIYAVSKAVREGKKLMLDLMPDWSYERVLQALSRPRKKETLSNHLRKTLRLDGPRRALLLEFSPPAADMVSLAKAIKGLVVRHQGLRPLEEAISTAGGVAWNALDDTLMLRNEPGVFVAGEMLDWEAPTGGYLLTACLATGRKAGASAANWIG